MSLDQAFNWANGPPGKFRDATPPAAAPAPSSLASSSSTSIFPASTSSAPPSSQDPFLLPLQRNVPGSLVETTSPPRPPRTADQQAAADATLLAEMPLVFDLIDTNPKQAAHTLVALLVSPRRDNSAEAPPKMREMGADARKQIIDDMRFSDSCAFWGALLDQTQGRQLLAAWLRDTVDGTDAWRITRLPLLRLLERLPMLKEHILDDATGNCLAKAVGAVKKNGPEKSRNLATEIRGKWIDIANGKVAAEPPSRQDQKRLATEDDDNGSGAAAKKLKTAAPKSATSLPGDNMQSLNALSQSSAYLSATSALGAMGNATGKAGPSSRLTTSGAERSGDLQNLAKKTVTRTAPEVKEVCSNCKTAMIPGVTSTTRIKPSMAATRKVETLCNNCKEKTKKAPAPPSRAGDKRTSSNLAVDDDDGDERGGQDKAKIPKAAPRRPAQGRDMFNDLMSKPAVPSKTSSGNSSSTGKLGDSAGASAAPPPPKKKVKKVRWKEDAELVLVREIETRGDQEETGSAAGDTSGEQHDLHELDIEEGKALKSAYVDLLDEEVDWYSPREVDTGEEGEERAGGVDSEEAKAQQQREKSVLSAVYIEDTEIPSSPAEPTSADIGGEHQHPQPPSFGLPSDWDEQSSKTPIADLLQQLQSSIDTGNAGQTSLSAGSLEQLGISPDAVQRALSDLRSGPDEQGSSASQPARHVQGQQHPPGAAGVGPNNYQYGAPINNAPGYAGQAQSGGAGPPQQHQFAPPPASLNTNSGGYGPQGGFPYQHQQQQQQQQQGGGWQAYGQPWQVQPQMQPPPHPGPPPSAPSSTWGGGGGHQQPRGGGSNDPYGESRRKTRPCRFWRSKEGCTRGDDCWFIHN